MANAAEIIAQRLHQAGVRAAYGIPGGEVLTMIKALDETGIEFVLTKHENAAGFMAEGGYHASGSPAVLVATVGPGVANAINFIVNAMQDRVPVIYITGCMDAKEAVTYTHQVFDHGALLSSVTKASIRIIDGVVEEQVDKAIAIAMDDPPGPVHIDLPIALAASRQSDREVKQRAMIHRGCASGVDFDRAKQWVAEAKCPLLIAGVEALYQHAEKEIESFCKHFNLPLIITYKGKGILAEDHDMALGSAGLSPRANRILIPFLQQADVVILTGYDPIEMRNDWRNPRHESSKIIELTAIPNTHYMHQADLSFVGDVGASLQTLGKLRSKNSDSWVNGEVAQVKGLLNQAFQSEKEWGPAQLIAEARRVLPANTVITADTGAHRILLSQMWTCYSARSMMQSSALCTMGCAVPLAVGYKKIQPDTPVVAFTGDAGLEMVLGDLATLRDTKQPVIIIVFVDDSLALIEMKQRAMSYKNIGVDSTGSTDFVQVAKGFDLESAWVDDTETFITELQSALKNTKSTLLACRIGRKSYDGKI